MTQIKYILLFITIYLCKTLNSQFIVIPNNELNLFDVYPLNIQINLYDNQTFLDDEYKNSTIVQRYNKIILLCLFIIFML
jgi:hypothetical protein